MKNIRLLPMSMDDHEFNGKSIEGVQKDFFEDYLKYNINHDNDNFYNYKSNALRSNTNDLVLFQYNNKLIASADYVNAKEYPLNWTKSHGYRGYYLFENIRTFKPITNAMFNSILKIPPIKFRNAPYCIKQINLDYDKLEELMNIPR